jgi:parallel beta-helix repeat protein
MKALFKIFSLTVLTLSTMHTNLIGSNARQSLSNFHYMKSISNSDFRKSGDLTLVETFTINNPGVYTLAQDIKFEGRSSVNNSGDNCAIYINSDNVTLDLGSFAVYSGQASPPSNQKAIDVVQGSHNVSIKNGNITGFADTGIFVRRQCNNVRLSDMTISNCKKNGIVFAGTSNTAITDSNQISNCTIDNVTVAETAGVNNSTAAAGLRLLHCYNILVKDSSFGYANAGALAIPQDSYGAWVVSSTNVIFNNCDASGNYGGSAAYGFKLSGTTATSPNTTGCNFVNCTANGNSTISANSVCYAFSGSSVRACSWKDCTASGNEALQTTHGFFYSNAQYCQTTNCTANNNRGGNDGVNNLHGARGCYSITGTGNIWKDCITNGQAVSSGAPSATMAIGIELDGEYLSLVQGCESSNNGSSVAVAWGIGINLRYLTSVRPSFYCTIDNCTVMNNQSSTASQGAGIRDVGSPLRTHIINCYAFNNGVGATMQNYPSAGVYSTEPASYDAMGDIFTCDLAPYINVDIKA